MVHDRFNPQNTITLLAVFAGLTVLLGLFYPTNWGYGYIGDGLAFSATLRELASPYSLCGDCLLKLQNP
jgi:hypothetical protein